MISDVRGVYIFLVSSSETLWLVADSCLTRHHLMEAREKEEDRAGRRPEAHK
jgi:hypothetical protein